MVRVTFEAPWLLAAPRGSLSACTQHQLEWITPMIVSNSSGKGKAEWKAMQRDGRKEPASTFFYIYISKMVVERRLGKLTILIQVL